jgi:intermediate cleaving peptidase 55
MLLYSTGKDPSKEKWDGASTRFEDVVALFGADDARPLESFADDLRALTARAEHVYVDAPAPAHHHHHHRHNRHRAHHRRRVAASSSSSAATSASSLLKHYFSRGQRQRASSSDDVDAESGPSSYFDVVPAWKRSPLSPLVGKLRCVKSAYEIEVMKASAEISARAHAKVSGVGVSVAYRSYLPSFSLFG